MQNEQQKIVDVLWDLVSYIGLRFNKWVSVLLKITSKIFTSLREIIELLLKPLAKISDGIDTTAKKKFID